MLGSWLSTCQTFHTTELYGTQNLSNSNTEDCRLLSQQPMQSLLLSLIITSLTLKMVQTRKKTLVHKAKRRSAKRRETKKLLSRIRVQVPRRQVNWEGAGKFATLHQVLAWSRGLVAEGEEQVSHLCGKPACLIAEHVVIKNATQNNGRKGCGITVPCPHGDSCPLWITTCRHNPPCNMGNPGTLWVKMGFEVFDKPDATWYEQPSAHSPKQQYDSWSKWRKIMQNHKSILQKRLSTDKRDEISSVYPLLTGNSMDVLALTHFARRYTTLKDDDADADVALPACDTVPMVLSVESRQKLWDAFDTILQGHAREYSRGGTSASKNGKVK
uniref:Zinc-binding loop region of homing endonuclease domain-containing protein n=2 Tax=Gibberella zeae (strain ATCC MYA-4620 / CBS 123657 / FGSC 9075 / NRRL 31084 / PH-1) TaxID=229533 RepID=A0A098DN10_GIBZE